MNGLMDNKLLRQIITIGVILILVIGGVWLFKKQKPEEEKVAPEIILESSKMMEGEAALKQPMSEAEKQAIDAIFTNEGAEMTMLKDVSGGQAVGTAWRHASEKKFALKVEASKLAGLDKGFFYEGWLVSDKGFFSTGRMAEVNGEGKLYYQADEDKSEFKGVVITREPEDGDPAPAAHVLEGNF